MTKCTIDELFRLAGNGELWAQNSLGSAYAKGEGVEQDLSKAMRWFRRAADQGDSAGQWGVGFLYAKGLGVRQDYSEARKWFLRAADQGDAESNFSLGLMYEGGLGVEKDLQKAQEWFKKAAELGHEASRERLPYYAHARKSFQEMTRRMEESSGPSQEISVEGGPGDTVENAFVIKGVRDNLEGIYMEYAVLGQMFGEQGTDWDVLRRDLVAHNDRLIDLFQIRIPGSDQCPIFFDVTDFVGKD